MTLELYNTRTRKKETFKPIEDNLVKFYSCGPTVYNYAHLGNLRTYVFNDLLKRALLFNGYEVKHVMNITDVGHLTDDADDGEDKMEKGAQREGKTVWDIARYYTEEFQKDIKKLNILDPDHWPKATEHIKEMIEVNQLIERNGYAYMSNDNLYFDTSKFERYAEFARLNLDNLNEGARTEKDESKRNHTDFVLWFGLKGSKFGEKHTMKWESPWGVGYPGWHIECCAMSSKYLGRQFDIHTGGIDHIPVHHTNEIAQAETAFDVHPWVNYWLHGNFLVTDKEKMAKSTGNFLRMGLLEDKGYDPMAYRYFCLTAHYRSELTFSWEALENAQNAFVKLRNKIIEIKQNPEKGESVDTSRYEDKFLNAVNDDLNIPVALATAQELISDKRLKNSAKLKSLMKFDEILGLDIKNMESEFIEAPEDIKKMLAERETARGEKDFDTADRLRDEIKAKGFVITDTKEGPKVKKV
ncbi:MAG: cysteine--tRNA ligase [Candidatus Woesearchaeota archaeon]